MCSMEIREHNMAHIFSSHRIWSKYCLRITLRLLWFDQIPSSLTLKGPSRKSKTICFTTYATFESPSPTIIVSSPWTLSTLPTINNPNIVNSGSYSVNIRNTIKNILPMGQSKIKYTKKIVVSTLTLHLSYNYHKIASN